MTLGRIHDWRPNLFVVGAAKCGTTSMYEYLRAHPAIFMSPIKEPHCFGRDLDLVDHRRVCRLEEYQNLFAPATAEKYVGEGSVWYLYSRSAAEEIHEFNPEAKIVIMLRNPVDQMYSLHGQFLSSYNEDILDFAHALEAQEDRRNGLRIPRAAHFPSGLQYEEVAKFSAQVQRYLDAFGRDSVHVILFDDLVRDVGSAYQSLLEFLGVSTGYAPRFDIRNPAQTILPDPIDRFLKNRPRLRCAVRRATPRRLREFVGSIINARQRPINRPKSMPPSLRFALQKRFTNEVRALERVLDADLSHWLRPSGLAHALPEES